MSRQELLRRLGGTRRSAATRPAGIRTSSATNFVPPQGTIFEPTPFSPIDVGGPIDPLEPEPDQPIALNVPPDGDLTALNLPGDTVLGGAGDLLSGGALGVTSPLNPKDLSPFVTAPDPQDPQRGPGGLVPGKPPRNFIPNPPPPILADPAPVEPGPPPPPPVSPDVEEDPLLARIERIQRRTLLGSP